jgi:Tol biopolymer transport system component
MTSRSLALDSGRHPHIAYGGDHLDYVWYDSTQWHQETVDGAWSVGEYASLAMTGMPVRRHCWQREEEETMKENLLRWTGCLTILVVMATLAPSAGQASPAPFSVISASTSRVSVASDGAQADDDSGLYTVSISADGRYVVFDSLATNLVSDDTNGYSDAFVHDRRTGETRRVSVASDGTQGFGDSDRPSISADGRYVAFDSFSSNLVSDDANDVRDVFVHDLQTGQTSLVSIASDSTQGNQFSYGAFLSADGRYVVFASYASNLVSGDTNDAADIFVRDRQTGQTSRVSIASDGTQGADHSLLPSISADGRYVAFFSYASNLVSGDTNGYPDVFVHDRQTGQTTRVSVASDGAQGNEGSGEPSLSADGRFVAFASNATNLVGGDTNGYADVFVHDCQTGETGRVSIASDGTQGNDGSAGPSLSATGRFVAFYSMAYNLVSNDANFTFDVFVHDRQTGETSFASVSSDGKKANGASIVQSISTTGRYVAFASGASNLVSGDSNGEKDVFVRDRGAHQTYLPIVQK